jgi:hypothetical protein
MDDILEFIWTVFLTLFAIASVSTLFVVFIMLMFYYFPLWIATLIK